MIELLKQTLEAFEIAAEGGRVHFHSYAEALRQAIAELESQELKQITVKEDLIGRNLNDDNYSSYKDELDAICQAKIQRTWQGLTDEEYTEIRLSQERDDIRTSEMLRKVEAKLKQKNGFAEEKNT
jgi:Mn-containing catalase